MPTLLIVTLAEQLVSIVIFSVISLIILFYRWRALQQELAALTAGVAPEVASQRFIQACTHTQLATSRTYAWVFLGGTVLFIFVDLVPLFGPLQDNVLYKALYNDGDPFLIIPNFVLMIIALLIGLCTSAFLIQDLAGTLLVDQPAQRAFQLDPLPNRVIVRNKLGSLLFIWLPLIVLLECLVLIKCSTSDVTSAFALLSVVIVMFLVYHVIDIVFSKQIYALRASLQPLEQTRWASLLPRIEQWMKLSGVSFSSIQLEHNMFGTTNLQIVGLFRPALIISERLLRNTDWRQQDAIVAIAIGSVRTNLFCWYPMYSIVVSLMGLVTVGCLLLISYLLPLGEGVFIYVLTLIPLLLLIFILLLRPFWRRLRALYFDTDCIAARLTGDPVAIMILMNTLATLNGLPPDYSLPTIPSIKQHMQKLDELSQQMREQAPYASLPVPSITSVQLGSYVLTTPLTPETPAEPAPVPNRWYMATT